MQVLRPCEGGDESRRAVRLALCLFAGLALCVAVGLVVVEPGERSAEAPPGPWAEAHAEDVPLPGLSIDGPVTRGPVRVMVHSEPPGADAYLNGVYVGRTPLRMVQAQYLLRYPELNVELRKAGYTTAKQRIAVAPDQDLLQVNLSLARAPF